mmetsp:Transcript_1170/g.1327  ORF Transcript_1170/g.1327 Transcript_1170/m.1327 type:complete len:148 (-) Transcript_1170:617-1060(-)
MSYIYVFSQPQMHQKKSYITNETCVYSSVFLALKKLIIFLDGFFVSVGLITFLDTFVVDFDVDLAVDVVLAVDLVVLAVVVDFLLNISGEEGGGRLLFLLESVLLLLPLLFSFNITSSTVSLVKSTHASISINLIGTPSISFISIPM